MAWFELETYYDTVLYTLSVLTALWLLTRLLRLWWHRSNPFSPVLPLPAKPEDPGHHWAPGGLLLPLHCTLCQTLLIKPVAGAAGEAGQRALTCTDCGLACCDRAKCLKSAQRRHRCKAISLVRPPPPEKAKPVAESPTKKEKDADDSSSSKMRHHWVSGNLPLMSECEVCESSCSDGPESGLEDLQCCWCHRTVHAACRAKIGDVCDLGDFRRFVVPPGNVTAKPGGRTVRHPMTRRWIISRVTAPDGVPGWSPLVVIGNTKAGNNDGAAHLNAFRGQLNPAQVIDLSQLKAEDGLHWCELVEDRRCVVLVAGGDGTIGWVLDTIDALGLKTRPLVCLLPLGTGNDLARTLGYGAGGDFHDVREFLSMLQTRTVETDLDRWRVEISQLNPRKNFAKISGRKSREIFIQNYMSIGVDALVTYNFHRTRENQSVPFSGRLFNKLLYFIYGTKDVLERECKDLDKILELRLDGNKVELPNIESVVILNIPCWGAGVRPWELGKNHVHFDQPEIDDGLLEVFCVYSSFHIAQMQVGLSEPHRIGHAREVNVRLKGRAPVQTDGEPWIQGPAEVNVTHHGKVKFLRVKEQPPQ